MLLLVYLSLGLGLSLCKSSLRSFSLSIKFSVLRLWPLIFRILVFIISVACSCSRLGFLCEFVLILLGFYSNWAVTDYNAASNWNLCLRLSAAVLDMIEDGNRVGKQSVVFRQFFDECSSEGTLHRSFLRGTTTKDQNSVAHSLCVGRPFRTSRFVNMLSWIRNVPTCIKDSNTERVVLRVAVLTEIANPFLERIEAVLQTNVWGPFL